MHVREVSFEVMLELEHPRANVTLEGHSLTHAMYSSHVTNQFALFSKLPAANLALVPGVRMLRSDAAFLSMRRVVVSADR